MDKNLVLLIMLVVAVVSMGVWIIYGSHKKQWYKVFLANNDVMLLYRDLNERWWRTNDKYMRFKNESGLEVTFTSGAHWVLMMIEVPKEQLDSARVEVARIKESQRQHQNET